jgi:hypothetical protein
VGLVAFARRCPECPAVDAADLSPPAGRTAFTWRETADQTLALDEMTLRLKRKLGRPKQDKAEMLDALVGLAEEKTLRSSARSSRGCRPIRRLDVGLAGQQP